MTLGSTIRDAREAARLSIASLSESTSIRIGLLTEMENNNFAHCGGDTYARGHLRNIAPKIGMDAQTLINQYNEEHSTEHRAIQDLLVENNVMQVPREERKISWKIPAIASVAVLLILGLAQIVISNQGADVAPVSTTTTTASPTPTAAPSNSATVSQPVENNSGPVELSITAARGNSYIHIIADGETLAKGSIFQGETKSFKGEKVISIYFSNPAGLDVTLNGKQLSPLGGQNEEVRRTFR
jgi:cytoskeletal protein RodZ